MLLIRINEKTWSTVDVSPLDADDAPVTPASAEYRIDCLHSRTEVIGMTALTPATTMPIIVTAAQNAIVNESSPYEDKEITVHMTDGGGNEWYERYRWRVVNLAGGDF